MKHEKGEKRKHPRKLINENKRERCKMKTSMKRNNVTLKKVKHKKTLRGSSRKKKQEFLSFITKNIKKLVLITLET